MPRNSRVVFLFSFSVLGALLLGGCTERKVQSATTSARPVDHSYDDAGRFLAGRTVGSDSPFFKLEKEQPWKDYAAELAKTWAGAQQTQFAPVDEFQKRELASKNNDSSFIFYPFSGPDVLYATRFFPDGKEYVFAGLEHVGEVQTLERLTKKGLNRELDGWKSALNSIFRRSFFVTSEMDRQFHGSVANGLLPMMLLLLSLSHYDTEKVQYGKLDDQGSFIPEEAGDGSRHMGVEITFHREGETIPRRLYYFSTKLGPEFEQDPSFEKFLEKQGTPDTLVKSGSFLLHWQMCAALRSYILQKSNLILEDDTGVPYHYFQNADWKVKLYGEYSHPDKPFRGEYQKDLAEAFQDSSKVRPLGFSLGYGAGRRPSSLLLAERVRPGA